MLGYPYALGFPGDLPLFLAFHRYVCVLAPLRERGPDSLRRLGVPGQSIVRRISHETHEANRCKQVACEVAKAGFAGPKDHDHGDGQCHDRAFRYLRDIVQCIARACAVDLQGRLLKLFDISRLDTGLQIRV
jgi:hypothetical protein